MFNNVDAIENLEKIDTICFDKTGTLTTGEMSVSNIYILTEYLRKELMKYVYSVEKLSGHPVAKSVINYAIDNNINAEKDVKRFFQ